MGKTYLGARRKRTNTPAENRKRAVEYRHQRYAVKPVSEIAAEALPETAEIIAETAAETLSETAAETETAAVSEAESTETAVPESTAEPGMEDEIARVITSVKESTGRFFKKASAFFAGVFGIQKTVDAIDAAAEETYSTEEEPAEKAAETVEETADQTAVTESEAAAAETEDEDIPETVGEWLPFTFEPVDPEAKKEVSADTAEAEKTDSEETAEDTSAEEKPEPAEGEPEEKTESDAAAETVPETAESEEKTEVSEETAEAEKPVSEETEETSAAEKPEPAEGESESEEKPEGELAAETESEEKPEVTEGETAAEAEPEEKTETSEDTAETEKAHSEDAADTAAEEQPETAEGKTEAEEEKTETAVEEQPRVKKSFAERIQEYQAYRRRKKLEDLDEMIDRPTANIFEMLIKPVSSMERISKAGYATVSRFTILALNIIKWLIFGSFFAHVLRDMISAVEFSTVQINFTFAAGIAFKIALFALAAEYAGYYILSLVSGLLRKPVSMAALIDVEGRSSLSSALVFLLACFFVRRNIGIGFALIIAGLIYEVVMKTYGITLTMKGLSRNIQFWLIVLISAGAAFLSFAYFRFTMGNVVEVFSHIMNLP